MAGSAPEGTQFDARQFDQKLNEVLEGQDEFFTSYDEVHESFDAMGLQENLLRGIYAYGFEKPSAIQQRGIVPFCKGLDVIQQAQSGTGKTATFCSGVLQQLDYTLFQCQALVLAPTRELAQQIEKVMRALGDYLGVKVHACVGGTSVREDQRILQAGVHVVVGTPGRVFDMLRRQSLRPDCIKMFVLDEADEMLRMGFVEDVELILGKVEDANKVQTLLFSATLPSWVKNISTRFLKVNKKTIDLVGNDKMKASNSVRHIVLPCNKAAMSRLIPDVISCYSSGGRTIIFTEKKDEASELSGLLAGARPLHGDIQQSQREVTLAGFRNGKFSTLVATNVAARGLDISDVQLIIQCEPPREVEAYIHRSGRTGRAGNTGVAVMLYDPRRSSISKIERESGIKFEHISAPQPADIARAVGMEAAEKITQVCDSVVPAFLAAAKELLKTSGLSAEELLAKALAKTAGFTEIKKRSLLTAMENHVTLHLEAGKPMYSPSYAYGMLRRMLPEAKVELIEGLTLTADGTGAVFDVVQSDLDLFLAAGQKSAGSMSLEVVKELPKLQEREPMQQRRYGGRNSGGNRFGGRGRGGGGRGGGRGQRW